MDPNLILFGIALLNAFTAVMAYHTHKLTKQVEVATNSMKDALVKSTGEAAHALGVREGRLESEARTADRAEGAETERKKE